MKTFKEYATHEQWLEARNTSVGASTIGRWAGMKDITPPPEVQQVQDAMLYGSLWEPYIAKQFAFQKGLSTVKANTPFERLEAGQLTWHNDSIMQDDSIGYHVSFDAAYRDRKGRLVTVEIKTGNAPRFTFVSPGVRKSYKTQANVERIMAEADECVIVYSQRIDDWMNKTSDTISEWVNGHLEMIDVTDETITENSIIQWVSEINNRQNMHDVEGEKLLDEYINAKQEYEQAKERLSDHLYKTGGTIVGSGYVAKYVTATRRRTNWSKLAKEHDDVAKIAESYTTETESGALSVTKDKTK